MGKKFFKKVVEFMSKRKSSVKEKKLIKRIENGLENNEFKMHLQFIVDNKTKKIVLSEALSRWETSMGEVIFPGDYIGLMEKSGMIVDFDYYMFDKVCAKLSEWKDTEFDDIGVSCNITRITISEKLFVAKIKEIADKYDFDRSKLILEITEDSIEKNMEIARNNVIKAKELGFGIALDDIGSGYTSLLSLCDYPIDIVKIDRAVILHADGESGRKLLLGIISLIRSLNMKSVCEGVETEEQNALLSESECDYIQGWYYSKGLCEDKAEEFFTEYMKKF